MSKIHQCNDGTEDITGRGTPNKIPCENQGGVVGSAPPPPPPPNPTSTVSDVVSTLPPPPTMQPPPPRQRVGGDYNKGKTKQLLIFLAIGVVVVGAGMWYYKNRIEPKSFR